MKKILSTAFAVALALSPLALSPLSTSALETDGPVRDPSRIIKAGQTYWVYGTGAGTQQFSSVDRVHWARRGPALPKAPAWVATSVPGNKDNVVWAPDVIRHGARYFLFYSYSAWGSNKSAIGVAINNSNSLDPSGWADQGIVVASTGTEGFNAIDPAGFEDAAGNFWMCFGSYVQGIRMVRLDSATGKRSAEDSKIYELGTRPGVPVNPIEASYVHFHDGWYYLFVNWDFCCRAAKSDYNIRVGRSRSVTGPFLDKAGKDMNQGGGSLFLNAMFDNGSGRTIDDATGPGHVGILEEDGNFWLSTHYEWTRSTNRTTMFLNRMAWDDEGGWPRVMLDEGPWKLVSNLPLHDLASIAGGAAKSGARIQTAPFENVLGQRWRLQYQGDGYYSILSREGALALGTADNSDKPGAAVELAPYTGRDGQMWFAQRNEDGTMTFLTKVSNKVQALDVGGCNPSDGVAIGTWNSNGLDCQKWSLRLK